MSNLKAGRKKRGKLSRSPGKKKNAACKTQGRGGKEPPQGRAQAMYGNPREKNPK